jgi:hypothetical protein
MYASRAATTLPPSLIDDLSCGRVVPFIGAGLSRRAGLPDWPQLLIALISAAAARGLSVAIGKQIRDASARGQYELASDALATHLGDQLGSALAEILDPPGLDLPLVHTLLATVSWPAVITTNFDNLLPRAFGAHTRTITWLDRPGMENVLRSHSPHIMFAHGALEQPGSIVLTTEGYRRCLRDAAYRTYLKSVFTNYTVLFLGFSFTDRDVLWLLEDLRETFGASKTPHFALVATSDTSDLRVDSLRQNFNIEAIVYTPTDSTHPEFETLLRQVVDHCPGPRRDLASTLDALKVKQPGLDAVEYLRQYAETCRQLSESGYSRSAWVSLQAELHRAERDLALQDRVVLSMVLARLEIADAQYESASNLLYGLSALPLHEGIDAATLREFANLWFHAGFQSYRADVPNAALMLAREAGCKQSQLDALDTYTALFTFLHGDPEFMIPKKAVYT